MQTRRFVVIGLGRFGNHLARALMAGGAEVVAIDRNGALVEAVRDEVTVAVRLDSTDMDALSAHGVKDVDAAIVGIGEDFESAVLTVAVLKELNVPHIYARAESEVQARIIRKVGADDVVNPERESALRWAHRLSLPNLRHYIDLGENHAIVYLQAPSAFWNKTLSELALRAEHGVTLVAIRRNVAVRDGSEGGGPAVPMVTVPTASTTIVPEDTLILVGSNEALAKLPSS